MRGMKRMRVWFAVALILSLMPGFVSAPVSFAETAVDEVPEPTSPPRPGKEPLPDDLAYPGLTLKATLGYDGRITYLYKIPVRVSLVNEGESLEGVLAMNVHRNQAEYDRYEMPFFLAAQAEIQVELPVELTMKQAYYQLEVVVDEQVIASATLVPTAVMDPNILLTAALSENPTALSHLIIRSGKDPLNRDEQWDLIPLSLDTFPRDPRMLDAFAFLAVDGMDLNALDAGQREALDEWLEKGGIVIVGGGAQAVLNYPFFEKYTGISMGRVAESSADITPALLRYIQASLDPLGSPVPLSEMKNGKNPLVSSGGVALLDQTTVGRGCVFTAAFSLSDRPLNGWQNTNALWQRILLAAMSAEYGRIVSRQKNFYSREMDYVDSYRLTSVPIRNDNSYFLPLAVLLVFVALVGFGSYLLLKRKDLRDWMWVTVPATSLFFALLLLAMGNSMTFKSPVAVFSDMIFQNERGEVTERVSVCLSVPETTPVTVTANLGRIQVTGNRSNYYGEEEPAGKIKEMRYVHHLGDKGGITLRAESSWSANEFFVADAPASSLKLEGSCWWEKDGLHIRVANRGAFPLAGGYVLTMMGYCKVPAILPGEEAECLLANADDPMNANDSMAWQMGTPSGVVLNGNGNMAVREGSLLTGDQQRDVMGLYTMLQAVCYPELWTDSPQGVSLSSILSREERESREAMERLLNDYTSQWSLYDTSALFLYFTMDDSLCDIQLTVNGQPVKRTAQSNGVGAMLQYFPVGRSGIVNFPRGTIPTHEASATGDGGYRRGREITERHRLFSLSDKPTFFIALPKEIGAMRIDKLDIGIEYAYGNMHVRLYNWAAGDWEELDIKKSLISQLDMSKHLSPEGELLVQYAKVNEAEQYAEISIPWTVLEGEVI